MSGDWGFEGGGRRVFELPNVDTPEPDQDLAPPGRIRLRVNTPSRQLEQSVDGDPWEPLGTGSSASGPLSQSDFYIDPVSGSDNNSGESPAEAIATWEEYAKRIGTGVVTATPFQFVHILNDLPATDPILVEAVYRNGLIVQGERTTVISGTVTSATAWDTASTPITPGTLEDASLSGTSWSDSGPGGTSLIGKQIVMTSGANVGKTGWLLADLGGKVARISQLFDVNTFATGTPAPGDTFDVVDLTVVAGGIDVRADTGAFINFDRLDVSASEPLQASGGVLLPSDSRFVQTGGFTLSVSNCEFQSLGCLWTNSLELVALKGTGTYFCNSFIDARVQVDDTSVIFFNVNALQKDGGAFVGSNAFTVASHGSLLVLGALGVLDQTVGSPTAFDLDVQSMMGVGAGGRAFTLNQTVGRGIHVGSYAVATWAPAASASVYAFDISGPAIEWSVGGTTTTSAALGAGGTINATNNAGAVPDVA